MITVEGPGVYRADCDCHSCEVFEVAGTVASLQRECRELGWAIREPGGSIEDLCAACAKGTCGHKSYEPPARPEPEPEEPEPDTAEEEPEPAIVSVPKANPMQHVAAQMGPPTGNQFHLARVAQVAAAMLLFVVVAQEQEEYSNPEAIRIRRQKEKARWVREREQYKEELQHGFSELDALFGEVGMDSREVIETDGVEVI